MLRKFVVLIVLSAMVSVAGAKEHIKLIGRVLGEDGEAVEFASVYIREAHAHCMTDERGEFKLVVPTGCHTLEVAMLGYASYSEDLDCNSSGMIKRRIVLGTEVAELNEVVLSAKSQVSQINESAYNATAIDAVKLHNSSENLAGALNRLSGVKLRETGGVGSDMQLSLDGFSGRHIKLFIDGVPQEGNGGSLTLNNIPINFAERIEVYKGVVPVGFGTDAIGGVINIVTGKRRRFYVDASYSFGSFNTHKSYLNVGQGFENGLFYDINLFQNYSDNSYYIDTPVKDLSNGQIDSKKIERVKRFHDTYHNEALVGRFGIEQRKFADKLMLSLTLSNNDKEIQNGVRQEIVFGEKRRRGRSVATELNYSKSNLLVAGLNVNLTVNYSYSLTHNLDTATRSFNGNGASIGNNGSVGEQNYQNDIFANNAWNGTGSVSYRLNDYHRFVFNHTLSSYERSTVSSVNAGDNSAVASSFGKRSLKNISGLSYMFHYKEYINGSIFGKYYNQHSTGPRNGSTTGGFDYELYTEKVDAWGYGAALSSYVTKGLQLKASFEKAYRLPTTEELFGDEDLELGAVGLRPESSYNVNASIAYRFDKKKHGFTVEAGYIYRNTSDYIRRTINSYSGGLYFGLYENHGRVETQGVNAEVRYHYADWVTVGGNISYLNIVDKERYVGGNTLQESTTYNVRLPNTPYLFSNVDATFTLPRYVGKGNMLQLSYNMNYVHEFPLYWENHGNKKNKQRIPTQLSHDVSVQFLMQNGRYNFSLECINIGDALLYDNFSLQKAGRAFYGKFRYYFSR